LVFLAINRRAHPASAGPENVQCRCVFIQFVRALVPRRLLPGRRVQPVLNVNGLVLDNETFHPRRSRRGEK
jgi:hypothetical protein